MQVSWKNIEIYLALYFIQAWLNRITICYTDNVILTHKPIRNIEFYFFWLSFRVGSWIIEYLFYRANEHTNFLGELMLKVVDFRTPHKYTMRVRAENEIATKINFGTIQVVKSFGVENESLEFINVKGYSWVTKS